jgi:hypothetical protein
MAIGSYGTAIWIDSHTEDYFGRGDMGQRLAGSFHTITATGEGNDETTALEARIESTTDSSVFDISEEDRWVRVAVDEGEGRIAVGSVDGMITILDYA